MTTTFTVAVEESDWREDQCGWACSALGIPGAGIEAVYTHDTKIDDAWYSSPKGMNIIRWVHGSSPPKRATVAIRLGKELSTQDLTGRWKKIAIVLPVMATLIVGVAARYLPQPTQTSTSKQATETSFWTIKGAVMNTHDFAPTEVHTFIRPPDLRLREDFTFEGRIPIQTRANGSLDLPVVVFGIKDRPGFEPPVVHLVNPGERVPTGATDYRVELDHHLKTIEIRTPIEIRKPRSLPGEQPYPEQVGFVTPPAGNGN